MNLFINICIRLTLILPIFLLISCGDSGSQLSKGHRDAIKIQCEDSSDPKACELEVRQNFLEDGNEFIVLDDGELNKDQIRKLLNKSYNSYYLRINWMSKYIKSFINA